MKILHRISLLLSIALIFGLYLLSNRKIPNSKAQQDEHYLRVFDLTPFLDNPLEFEARFGENVVFFIESSSSGRLGAREVCSVEALTFLSPNVKIFIIIANDVRQISLTKNPALTELLSVAQNLIIATVNSVQVVKGTPLEAISTTRFLETGSPVEHLSDFLRLGLLWKLGGVYMDLDLLTFRNIDEILSLKNFLAADTKDKINSCMMGFQRNHPFLKSIMAMVDKTYEPLDYSTVPRTLNVATVTTFRVSVEEAIKRGRIGDVHFLNYTVISPVTYDNHLMLYDELKGVLTEFMTKNSFGVHLWNSLGNIFKLKKNSTAPYAVIARKFCPRSFEKAEDLF
ncbi:lactosylceramide 4-alpha-galactosyltransferase-like [Neocloeon triangulifer]|uniref:lactosylceramide 4-alpha-galactosyltransferase-like n=1 Tax=Neocloeon triangulifer TaxID=2078957 RepID=UPI00286F5A17|nr:lactosylceramide 4-alpha-galactosyltransferase-like [Neocloeon triangulifer]